MKAPNRLSIAVAALVAVVCSASADDGPRAWLVGHWKSNKELTIPTLRFTKPLTPEQRSRVENIFGKYEICFGSTEATYHVSALRTRPAYGGTARYQILAEENDRLVVKCIDAKTGKEDVSNIRFEGHDRCWVLIDTIEWITGWQCFDRVQYPMPKEPPDQSPSAAPADTTRFVQCEEKDADTLLTLAFKWPGSNFLHEEKVYVRRVRPAEEPAFRNSTKIANGCGPDGSSMHAVSSEVKADVVEFAFVSSAHTQAGDSTTSVPVSIPFFADRKDEASGISYTATWTKLTPFSPNGASKPVEELKR
jgi:hypothetical protein